MIHLDTNYLIAFAAPGSPVKDHIYNWIVAGEEFATSTVAWSEFLNGPVTDQEVRDVSSILAGRFIPFGPLESAKAAELFNRAGRKRQKQIDCFIAATAICARTPLATRNRKDFVPFREAGLRLA
jgi:predicted nucleic acid-binding protein